MGGAVGAHGLAGRYVLATIVRWVVRDYSFVALLLSLLSEESSRTSGLEYHFVLVVPLWLLGSR